MEFTILGSGGCSVIPKPLCTCHVCEQARQKGAPYVRTGPSLFLHDENLLIDSPAEICHQLNRSRIGCIDHLTFTHLDPDHVEGFRVVEQIALDFRTWRSYPQKRIRLILPEPLVGLLRNVRSVYGPCVDFYEEQGFVECLVFQDRIRLGETDVTAIGVDRGFQESMVYVFEKDGVRVVYAPCDIKPFPEHREEVRNANLLVIQPGIFETGLKHGFHYPDNHISRTTLYTFEDTLALGERIQSEEILFVHLEEYWNRTHDDYLALENQYNGVRFAFDGMHVNV